MASNMPKAKKRSKPNRADKEKPLITMQGLLRLDKSFITAQHEGAEEITIRRDDEAEPETIRLIPGASEHDNVHYKVGYDMQPSNPHPQNKPEEEQFAERQKLEAREEAFQEMKESTEKERTEREERFKIKAGVNAPLTEQIKELEEQKKKGKPKEMLDPNDPSSYLPPPELRGQPGLNDRPLKFGGNADEVMPPGDEETVIAEKEKEKADLEEDEEIQKISEEKLPQMKPLPTQQSFSESVIRRKREEQAQKAAASLQSLPKEKENEQAESEKKVEAAMLDPKAVGDMALSVALEMEAKRKDEDEERALAGEDDEEDGGKDDDGVIYSLDEITTSLQQGQTNFKGQTKVQGPQEQAAVAAANDRAQKDLLDSYWQFVRENPNDFQGWSYLIQHVENIDNIDEVRTAYNAFLPLYPYCFAYWQRYSEIEKKHEFWQRALAILHRALEAIPLSVDLWVSYLELYKKMYVDNADFGDMFRVQCERAVQTVGLEYRSDLLWERYVEWEQERKDLKWMTGVFKRLVAIPTKMYNKHWDNFIAHIRDHHPRDILDYDEYEELRKVTCRELEIPYKPDPITDVGQAPRQVVQPEDKLKVGMKERIVASVVADHEKCEDEVDKRYRFEEKIKRTYYHVKPLDLKQLKNWNSYLDFEIEDGDHERIVVLFERCLIPCANYEQLWAKYAKYLESYHRKQEDFKTSTGGRSVMEKESALKKARWSFGTGLTTVDEMREKKCTWTLKGWKDKDEDGNEIMRAEEISEVDLRREEADDKRKEGKDKEEGEGMEVDEDKENDGSKDNVEVEDVKDKEEEAPAKTDQQNKIDSEMSLVPKTSWESKGRQAVRDVYRRACLVHCTKKAMIKLRWASFEEDGGDVEKAREILNELNMRYPLMLECCIQMVDIERRLGEYGKAEELYKKLVKKVPQNRKAIKTWLSMKLSRFQFKVVGLPDKALATLRSALKKERGDPRLYAQIIDVCYQRHPVDVAGVTAAIELAIKSPELTSLKKLDFVKRKVEFMQEFGNAAKYRDACEQLREFKRICSADLKVEARRKKELEAEEGHLKELETLKAQSRADASMKAELAAEEGRLLCTQCQVEMYPDEEGFYEFERSRRGKATKRGRDEEFLDMGEQGEQYAGAGADDDDPDAGVVDLLDMVIPEDQEEQIKQSLEEKTKYKVVAPTWELNIETYGYGKKRKVYDPDYEHVESAKFKEYERLEADGYDDELKDPDNEKPRQIPAPGLGLKKNEQKKKKDEDKVFAPTDYIIPPKVPQMQMAVIKNPRNIPDSAPASTVFELPPEFANLHESPCVNVPEWFVKEGGELLLSETPNGKSTLRYWPKFLSEKGNALMFSRLRRYCKWHQKQIKIGGEWKYETRLVAWYGPCDYNYGGLELDKNLNWAPELLDLLHRLIAMTRHEFNSSFLNLYRHGHDMCGWHSDVHPQLGRNPAIASVSLGAVRVFEFRRKNGPANFIRFPLFPGSMLLMEGATQEDWLHCLPRDPKCKEERINLTFRIMYSMN